MIELLESVDFEGFFVIIPSVSVGNVGQLASDLLIFNLNLKKLGYVWHPHLLTLAGADSYGDSTSLSTGCELFFSPSLKLVVFQIRSALTKTSGFVEELCTWLKTKKVKQVIILTGTSAHERRDKQLSGEPLRYVFCPLTAAEEGENAKSRNWVELEIKEKQASLQAIETLSFIPGSGLTVKLFNACFNKKIPTSILLNFCSDGDNIPDAIKLVDYLNEWLQLKEKNKIQCWISPPSWIHLFGSLPPVEIFN